MEDLDAPADVHFAQECAICYNASLSSSCNMCFL